MPSIHPKSLTPFGLADLKLDAEFSALTKVGDQMSRASLGSDNVFDQAPK